MKKTPTALLPLLVWFLIIVVLVCSWMYRHRDDKKSQDKINNLSVSVKDYQKYIDASQKRMDSLFYSFNSGTRYYFVGYTVVDKNSHISDVGGMTIASTDKTLTWAMCKVHLKNKFHFKGTIYITSISEFKTEQDFNQFWPDAK